MTWSKKEINILENFFRDKGEHYVSNFVNRSLNAIRIKASRLNIRKIDRDVELSFNEKQIILGGLMGDMYCRLKGSCKNAQIEGAHCKKQENYLFWKLKKLKNLTFNLRRTKLGYLHFESRAYPILNFYHQLFYGSGKKKITRNILNRMDVYGLAIWYMDDGSYSKRDNNCNLHTNGFTYKENIIIKKWFMEKWNVSSKIYIWKDEKRYPNNKRYYLHFGVRDTRKLMKILRPYFCSSMKYKLGIYAHEKNGKPMEVG